MPKKKIDIFACLAPAPKGDNNRPQNHRKGGWREKSATMPQDIRNKISATLRDTIQYLKSTDECHRSNLRPKHTKATKKRIAATMKRIWRKRK